MVPTPLERTSGASKWYRYVSYTYAHAIDVVRTQNGVTCKSCFLTSAYARKLGVYAQYEVVILCFGHGLKCANDLSYLSLRTQMGGAGVSSEAVNTTSLPITGRP
ncbi:hypothetical protein PIB30_097885 [Stylosanthes scabra]|uniref:Uncharacterized protein n=1 Tax=Stylosanthes scabra TaxID=79078 RepID=A0ABU6WXK8_9FABA|nr:hypothetical protein [Stylosanthes scabra]